MALFAFPIRESAFSALLWAEEAATVANVRSLAGFHINLTMGKLKNPAFLLGNR